MIFDHDRHLVRLVGAIAVVLSLAAAGMSATSRQATKSELQAKIRDAEARAKKIGAQIADSDQRRILLTRQISALEVQIQQTQLRIDEAEAALNIARTELYRSETSLARALSHADEVRESINKRAANTYKVGGGVYLEFLLGADSYRDFLTRFEFVRKVFGEDRARLDTAERVAQQLDVARTEAIQRRDDITAQKTSIEQEKASLAGLRQQLDSSRKQVLNEIATRRQLLSQVQAEKVSYLEAMARLQTESSSIGALLKRIQRGQTYKPGRQLAWPTTGPVTSGYGYRTHPIFGDRRFHAGIDIGAPMGARVIAAEAGSIVWASRNSGYGNVVVIDHGSGLATVAAHLSAISVRVGNKVGRGTTIGAVGCTGYCTGPHLHFETRVIGDPVNPMQFF